MPLTILDRPAWCRPGRYRDTLKLKLEENGLPTRAIDAVVLVDDDDNVIGSMPPGWGPLPMPEDDEDDEAVTTSMELLLTCEPTRQETSEELIMDLAHEPLFVPDSGAVEVIDLLEHQLREVL